MKTKRIRGGDWYDLSGAYRCARTIPGSLARRSYTIHNLRLDYLGFRVVSPPISVKIDKRKVRK